LFTISFHLITDLFQSSIKIIINQYLSAYITKSNQLSLLLYTADFYLLMFMIIFRTKLALDTTITT